MFCTHTGFEPDTFGFLVVYRAVSTVGAHLCLVVVYSSPFFLGKLLLSSVTTGIDRIMQFDKEGQTKD